MARLERNSVWIGITLLALAYAAAVGWILIRAKEQPGRNKTVIRVAHWQLEVGPRAAFAAVARRYMELHPDVVVEQMPVPETIYREWLRTQLQTENAPDLVEFDPVLQGMQDVYLRDFAPITRWVDEPNPYDAGTPLAGRPWRETFLDGLQNPSSYNEQLRNYFSVGLCVHSMRIFYNRNLLRAVTGSDTPPQTFEELMRLGAELRAKRPGVVLIAGSKNSSVWAMNYLIGASLGKFELGLDRQHLLKWSAADQFIAYLEGRWSYESPAVQAGLRMMRAEGAEMTPGFLQLDRDAAVQRFVRGGALMFSTGSWDATTLRTQAPFPVGIMRNPLPAPDDPAYGRWVLLPPSDGQASVALQLFLNRRSRHQAAAVDFLRFLTSREGNELFARVSGWLPSIEGVPVPAALQEMRPNFQGYNIGGLFIQGPGPDTMRNWMTNFYLLFAPDGGVARFTAALIATGRREAVRTDLAANVHDMQAAFRNRDPVLAARYFLDQGDPAAAATDATQQSQQHLSEARAYRILRTLADTEKSH